MRLLVCIFSPACVAPLCAARHPSGTTRFEASANSVEGITAKGTHARDGIVAADPTILPLGSRIRVSGAGAYSGVYVVTDIVFFEQKTAYEMYLLNNAEAKRFGRKTVSVRVLSRGDNK